jgi:hypothetical protein
MRENKTSCLRSSDYRFRKAVGVKGGGKWNSGIK